MNMRRTGLYLVVFVILTMIFIPSIAYGLNNPDKVKWELVFISRYSGCTNYQYQMTNQYDEITRKYFDLYQFENSGYAPQCMPDKKYSQYKPPSDLGLLILVYDYEIGRQDLNANDLGGVYTHYGQDRTKNNVIIFCDCPNFRFSDPVWILSHELSHFITYYLGFDRSVVEDKIHLLDSKYDRCIEISYDQSCLGIKAHLRGDHYFTQVTVMAPYAPAIGKKLTFEKNDTGTAPSPMVMNIEKEITKWWVAGKINDSEYTKVLEYITGQTKVSSTKPTEMVFADGPDGQKSNDTYHDVYTEWGKKKASTILSRVPFKMEQNMTPNDQIPDWFKSRAKWWSEGIIWNDQEFLSGAMYLLSNGTSGR